MPLLPEELWFFCPICNSKLDGMTQVHAKGGFHNPGPGDVSVCCYCETLIVMNKDKTWALCPEATAPLELLRARDEVRSFKASHPEAFRLKENP